MKASINRNFFNQLIQPLWKNSFQKTLMPWASRCSLVWQSWLGAVKTKARLLSRKSVRWAATVTPAVCLHRPLHFLKTKRHLVGMVMLTAGVLGFYSSLFFNPLNYNHAPCEVFGLTDQCFSFETRTGWCFMNWSIYLDAVGWAMGLIFWSVAGLMFVPPKYSLSWIPASVFHAIGWVKLLHISFFARSYETYHALPQWEIIWAAILLGVFGIIMSRDAVNYWENHKKRGNWQKWPAIYRSDFSQEEKNALYAKADKEYDQVHKMI